LRSATAPVLDLPRADRTMEAYRVGPPASLERPSRPATSRVLFAASHVVADPFADPRGPARLDWEATLAYRERLWSWGLGVAEAMDTAQRGMGLDWPAAGELIRRSGAAARGSGGSICAGAATDQLPPAGAASPREIAEAYLEQCALIEEAGAQPVLMASRALAAVARGPDDYREVYDAVLSQLGRPAIVHWLGELFDPRLAGYWGTPDLDRASAVVLELLSDHAERIDGIKVSLLDARREVELRRALPAGVRLYTGDDLNYPELIAGDGEHHSDALLGVFDAIAPVASAAAQALDRGDRAEFKELLEPTLPLARLLFRAPTSSYKTGLVFLAYLNGHQDHFRMLAGQESARSILHLSEVFRLADRAGVLADPELAVGRMRLVLALAGLSA